MRRYLEQIACVLRPRSVVNADVALRCFAAFLALPLRALQHDPGRATARNPAAAKKTSTIQPDDHTEVTGTGQHALLTAKAPMGGQSVRGGERLFQIVGLVPSCPPTAESRFSQLGSARIQRAWRHARTCQSCRSG